MRISKIELCNFGSYSGVNVFNLGIEDNLDKRIVLIGGKNGAGKTTLFSSIKLCLYGHKAEGFDGVNTYYRKSVKKYFNDISKYESDFKCYVKVDYYLSNGQGNDFYEVKREWNTNARVLSDFERVTVFKNGHQLDEVGLSDFDNFLLSLIPPELFNLFFFDGEQIADYFLAEGEKQRLKNAFMVLCGFDTLDIMEKNFRRLVYGKKNSESKIQNAYFEYKDAYANSVEALKAAEVSLYKLNDQIEHINYEISELEKQYKISGGVSYEEWSSKFLMLKEEENFREERKAYLKKMANEAIPFIIVRKQLVKVLEQAEAEREKQKLELLQQSLRQLLPDIMKRVYQRLEWQEDEELTEFVLEEFDHEVEHKHVGDIKYMLDLSDKEFSKLQSLVNICLNYDKNEIIEAEKAIADSLQRSQNLRNELEDCSIDGLQEYLEKKNSLIERKNDISKAAEIKNNEVTLLKQNMLECESALKREEKRFEEEIKKQSVKNLSEKAIVFLEEVQEKLYQSKIQNVQELFMQKIRILARKNNFIDAIHINKDFDIRVYKRVEFNTGKVCKQISNIGATRYIEEYGLTHCQGILDATKTESLDEFINQYNMSNEDFSILQEIDKSRLSKGEKQIFIMALYWAFMCLSKYEVPFIIDTPFARIDTEHRKNITKEFFMNLRGQVFIFSTNEEITQTHYDILEDNIQAKFLLENVDNISTLVKADQYFGGDIDAI